MIENLQRQEIKEIVVKALEEFAELSVSISMPDARDAIAARIASDVLDFHEPIVSPASVDKTSKK